MMTTEELAAATQLAQATDLIASAADCLREADPDAAATLDGVVRDLDAKLTDMSSH